MDIPSTSSGLLMYLQTKRLSSRGTWLGCKKIARVMNINHKSRCTTLLYSTLIKSCWTSRWRKMSKTINQEELSQWSVWLTEITWRFWFLSLADLILAKRGWQAFSSLRISTHMIDKINSSTSWWSNWFYNPRFSILQECR